METFFFFFYKEHVLKLLQGYNVILHFASNNIDMMHFDTLVGRQENILYTFHCPEDLCFGGWIDYTFVYQ